MTSANSERSQWTRLLILAVVAVALAHALDGVAWRSARLLSVNDKDWGRLLRSMGYLPTWGVIALGFWLQQRDHPQRSRYAWALLLGPALGGRVAAAAMVALVVALVMARVSPARAASRALPLAVAEVATPTLPQRLRTAMRSGFADMVDHTAPWILVGLIIAALLGPLMEGSWMTRLPAGIDVLLFAAIGLPLYVCASASTPLVAVLVAAGVSPGAGLALLITGPATNMATIGILSRLHGARFDYVFAAVMIGAAISVGLFVNAVLPAASMPTLSQSSLERTSPLELFAVIALAALYAASVLRRGARGFLDELRMTPA